MLVVLSLGIVLPLVLPFPPAQARIRYGGLLLQLAGILTVAFGVKQTRLFFGQPRPREMLGAWFTRFPKLHQNVTLTPDTLHAGVRISDQCRAQISTPDRPDAAVAERVDLLRRETAHIWEYIAKVEAGIDGRLNLISRSLRQEAENRQVEHGRLEDRLKHTATGGLYVSLTGALWLFVGVIMSTAAAEIACLIDR